jgi:hypothetical protein
MDEDEIGANLSLTDTRGHSGRVASGRRAIENSLAEAAEGSAFIPRKSALHAVAQAASLPSCLCLHYSKAHG